jgi:hypothetical protein
MRNSDMHVENIGRWGRVCSSSTRDSLRRVRDVISLASLPRREIAWCNGRQSSSLTTLTSAVPCGRIIWFWWWLVIRSSPAWVQLEERRIWASAWEELVVRKNHDRRRVISITSSSCSCRGAHSAAVSIRERTRFQGDCNIYAARFLQPFGWRVRADWNKRSWEQ